MSAKSIFERWLGKYLFGRAVRRWPGGKLPRCLESAVTDCEVLGPPCGQDAVVALLAVAGKVTGTGDAEAAGLAGWLDGLALRQEVAEWIWPQHRGAVLFLLEAVTNAPAAWSLPEGEVARAALLDLLVYEGRMQIADRQGVSFRVVERTAEALAGSLRNAHADRMSSLLCEAAQQVRSFHTEDWSTLRQWAASLRRRGLYWPNDVLPAEQPEAVRLQESGVPFGCLCPRPWPPALEILREKFLADASADIRLYDVAPVTVAVACLLRRELVYGDAGCPKEFDGLLHGLVECGWDALLPGAVAIVLYAQQQGGHLRDGVNLVRQHTRVGLECLLAWVADLIQKQDGN